MKKYVLVCSILFLALNSAGSTAWAREQTKTISANQVVLLARAAIAEEVEALNAGPLLEQPVAEGYGYSESQYAGCFY